MANNISTSVEQSKRLLELEIDPNSASMSYLTDVFVGKEDGYRYSIPYAHVSVLYNRKYKLPAWTLGDLLELIPSYIPKNEVVGYCLKLHKHSVIYSYDIGLVNHLLVDERIDDENKTMIDVLVSVIKQLKEKKLM